MNLLMSDSLSTGGRHIYPNGKANKDSIQLSNLGLSHYFGLEISI